MNRCHRFLNISIPTMLVALVLSVVAISYPERVESKSRVQKAQEIEGAQQSGQDSSVDSDQRAAAKVRTVSLTFKQMGAWSAVNLRGVDTSRTLSFPVRADEVVVAAKLRFAYDYSPSLIPELSHLRVLLNERIAAVEALPKDKELGNAREINLDPRLFRDLNNLRFNLIGHYTRQCEDPFHSSLWLTISELSRLELTLAPVAIANDLKFLPAPFFDKRENTLLKLPFVFSSAPSFGVLKAGGVVASWFGMQTGYRGAQFPVSLNSLPDGNAVVFIKSGEEIGGLVGPAGSTISIQPHPTNSNAKLLVLTGTNDEELARSARALTLATPTLAGQLVKITRETETAPRKPYDAPAWIATDRPVRFGELARPEELRVQGYFPEVVRVNYRVSPDLFTWRTPGTPLNLKYRATRLPTHHNSSLNISLNASFIETLALNVPNKKTNELDRLNVVGLDNSALREESLFIPPYAGGGRDQLQLSYFFDVIKEGECRSWPPDNLQAAIDPESTIDFSGFPHYVALPNLAYFSNIGFPYTRLADLSETAVVMPEHPGVEEIGMYLTVMGRMGEATAYPALRHEIVSSVDVDKMSAKDLIVIGSASDQRLMSKWADRLPMLQLNGERRVREPYDSWWPTYRWEQQDVKSAPVPIGSLNLSGSGNLVALMAFESPLQPTRSVVYMYADNALDLRKISDVLTDPERVSLIQGDFSLIDDKLVDHAKVGPTYYLGSLPALNKVRWFFSDQPLLLGLLALLICILLAVVLYRPLRGMFTNRARKTS